MSSKPSEDSGDESHLRPPSNLPPSSSQRPPTKTQDHVPSSPSLSALNQKVKKLKSRPHLKHTPSTSSKLIYSVDDDTDEVTDNLEREYLEGYNDALKHRLQQKRLRKDGKDREGSITAIPTSPLIQSTDNLPNLAGKTNRAQIRTEAIKQIPESHTPELLESSIINNLLTAEQNLTLLEELENDTHSTHSQESLETIESLNLRERQNAINTTHPFGIKIWKPSLYKKIRSVENKADLDIHDYDEPSKLRINIGVRIGNIIWTLTFGIFLFILCLIGCIFVLIGGGFTGNSDTRPYAVLLFKVGRYLFYPFGKIVLLTKDENYLYEDELDGISINEYQRWRNEEEGRLFYAPSKKPTESRPLLGPMQSYDSTNPDEQQNDDSDIKKRFFGRGNWSVGRILFYVYFYIVFQPLYYSASLICWFLVFTIPMAKSTNILCDHLRRHPLALNFKFEKGYTFDQRNQSVLLLTYRSCGLHYYKYTIDGTNIFLFNLLAAAGFAIIDFFFLKETLKWDTFYTNDSFIFATCLVSIIPLAYFIGQAVASISAQSSMGVGAVINAFFSSIVEIFLYCVALNQGKSRLVEGSVIGSILGCVLLLPGLSMCGGAVRRKTQRYNPRSAGVSSTMLLFATMVMFVPSLFYQIYGSYEIKCSNCGIEASAGMMDDCQKCYFYQPSLSLDNLYYTILRPFSLICVCGLAAAYVCGLWFTLRTHAAMIWATNTHDVPKKEILPSPSFISLAQTQQMNAVEGIKTVSGSNQREAGNSLSNLKPQKPVPGCSQDQQNVAAQPPAEEEHGGHDAPNWSRTKSTVILLAATFVYATIAEILVGTVDVVLDSYNINPKLLGLTVFALVPSTTEFLNAISFALNGNVALSMEIGSAYALQVVLIQIPCLVFYSVYQQYDEVEKLFSLIFPRWDIIASIISIYLFTYIYAEGKSNYFKGVILVLIYIVILFGFWFNLKVTELGIFNGSSFIIRGGF